MLTFLCGLTPAQWKRVHHHSPTGDTPNQPEGYKRSGLYEGRDQMWLIQYAGGTYRYWNYSGVFQFPTDERTHEEYMEIALKALEEAERFRTEAARLLDEADQLEQTAQDTFQRAFIGDSE